MNDRGNDNEATLQFFATPTHPCSYLPGREAVTLYLDPDAPVDDTLYGRLSALGFRRSGAHVYRPYCPGCNACVPVRLPVAKFQPRRVQKRVWRRNQDLEISSSAPAYSDEMYGLYARYLGVRHTDGDMYPPSDEQFRAFLVEGVGATQFHQFRLEGRLLCVSVADRLDHALSAIYTFFDPDEARRSLGVFSILWLVEATRRLNLDYLYLGYWIDECRKMSYKLDYGPAEVFLDGAWHAVE